MIFSIESLLLDSEECNVDFAESLLMHLTYEVPSRQLILMKGCVDDVK